MALDSWSQSKEFKYMENTKNSPGPREVADRALETSPSGRCIEVKVQVEPHAQPDINEERHTLPSENSKDTLVLNNVLASLSYRAIHSALKNFGRVNRIRLV